MGVTNFDQIATSSTSYSNMVVANIATANIAVVNITYGSSVGVGANYLKTATDGNFAELCNTVSNIKKLISGLTI